MASENEKIMTYLIALNQDVNRLAEITSRAASSNTWMTTSTLTGLNGVLDKTNRRDGAMRSELARFEKNEK